MHPRAGVCVALLATGRVCLRNVSLQYAVSSYLTLFTLTWALGSPESVISPDEALLLIEQIWKIAEAGGPKVQAVLVSVVLSLSLRTVAVSDYPALCCPDFPLVKQAAIFQAPCNYTTRGMI